MNIDEIKELLDLFNSSGVGELELEQDGTRIRIRKAGEAPEYVVSPSSGGQPQETAASSSSAPAAAATGLGTAHATPHAVADAGKIGRAHV